VLDGMTIQSSTMEEMVSTMEVVRQVMRTLHRLRPGVPDDFSMQTQDSALAFWKKLQGYLVLAGIVLPAIGLGRRVDRDHEHHARRGGRADARDRDS
jgi:hypothetical protein